MAPLWLVTIVTICFFSVTEWHPLVPDRPFIMGQMGSFPPLFLPIGRPTVKYTRHLLCPRSIHQSPQEAIAADEWMKYLQIISACGSCHYWQKPNKQGYRGRTCKHLVFRRSQTKRIRIGRVWQILDGKGRKFGAADLFVQSKSLQRIRLFKQIDGNNLSWRILNLGRSWEYLFWTDLPNLKLYGGWQFFRVMQGVAMASMWWWEHKAGDVGGERIMMFFKKARVPLLGWGRKHKFSGEEVL